MPEMLKEATAAGTGYDPLPDLALLLDATLRAGRDGSAYAERIAAQLGIDPDGNPETMETVLEKALGLPVRAHPRCRSCSRADAGGCYPCDCPVPCGARYCQHPMPAAADSDADHLRIRIHQHLREYPGLTAWEIGAALHVPATPVLALLMVMEDDGEAAHDDSSRPVPGWKAT